MLPIEILKPGTRLKVERKQYSTDEKISREMEEVRVIKQYPHQVLVENRQGNRRCVSHADLYVESMSGKSKHQMDIIYNRNGKRMRMQ